MTTEEQDLMAGSEKLTGRLIDLTRAAYWADDLHRSLQELNRFAENAPSTRNGETQPFNVVMSKIRDGAIGEYMTGAEEEEEERAEYLAYLEEVSKHIERIRSAAVSVVGNADYAGYLLSPPVWAKDDPWAAKKSPAADKPEGGELPW